MKDELFAGLGRLVFYFAGLEEAIHDAIRTALGFSEACDILLTGLSFHQLLDRFSLLYASLQAPDLLPAGVGAFCSQLSGLNEERNREIHSSWGFWESGVPARSRKRLRRGQGVSFSMESVRPDALHALAARMERAAELIYELQVRYVDDHSIRFSDRID